MSIFAVIKGKDMNDKQRMLDSIIDIVVDCCDVRYNGRSSVSREEVLGKCKRESVVLTRSMLALQLKHEGYTIDTIAMILDRSPDAVRDLITAGYNSVSSNKAYRRAAAEVALRCCDTEGVENQENAEREA